MKTTERKGWAVLVAKKGLELAPYILSIALILMCGLLTALGASMFGDATKELKGLVDAGAVPGCVYDMGIGMAAMFAGCILILIVTRRR